MSSDISQKLEALLFASGEPVAKKVLRKLLGCSEKELAEGFDALAKELSGRGIAFLTTDENAALVTAPQFRDLIHDFFQSEQEEKLSDAALETLAIIGYRGPIRASEISAIRGVDSSVVLRRLRIRGLVMREERTGTYQVSLDLLRHLGINAPKDFPKYEELHNLKIDE